MSIYTIKVLDNKNAEKALSDYTGKVCLIVNTATECGFTPNYEHLQALYEAYRKVGLEILDFPCNQFGNQAPGSAEEIADFCTSRFGVTFPQFAKIEVNGENEHALYRYLKSQKGFAGFDKEHKLTPILHDILSKADPDYEKKSDIKWNFTSFLIDKNGEVVERFEPTTSFDVIEARIKEII